MDRRDFLKLMGVTSGVTLLASCEPKKPAKLIPYMVPPEDGILPGKSIYYATTCQGCLAGCGVSVAVREKTVDNKIGRYPIKLEGLAAHPLNDGALCMRGQTSITGLFYSGRIKTPLAKGQNGTFAEISWDDAYGKIVDAMTASRNNKKENLFLAGATTGSLSLLIDQFCKAMQVERLPEFEPLAPLATIHANDALFGRRAIPRYNLETADFLLTVGADILETFGNPVNLTKQLARARRNPAFRWIHVEPHISMTGMRADKRITIKPGSEAYLFAHLLQETLKGGAKVADEIAKSAPTISLAETSKKTGIPEVILADIASSFVKAKKTLLINGGVSDTSEAAFLAGLLQWASGMTSSTLQFSREVDGKRFMAASGMNDLVGKLSANRVGVLFIARTDPVMHFPRSLKFSDSLKNATLRVGFADSPDETTKECDIVLPLSHYLESWGDAEPERGLVTLIQPAREPLYQSRSEGDILLQLMERAKASPPATTYQQYLFARWKELFGEKGVEDFLRKGYRSIEGIGVALAVDGAKVAEALKSMRLPDECALPALVLVPSLRGYDGRGRDLPLAQEIPDPLSTVSYGRWLSVSERDAGHLQVQDRDEVKVTLGDAVALLPIKIQPGLPDNVCLLQQGNSSDFSAAAFDGKLNRRSLMPNVSIAKTGQKIVIPILSGTLYHDREEIDREGHDKEKGEHHDHDDDHVGMYPKHDHKDYRWAMTVNLDACTGCSACVAACYVENNVSIVGVKEHLRGRELSWIRIEPHYVREADERGGKKSKFVPVMCQQCDDAPCESVCPVYATYHNPEGLNAQVYNRCVGTRYCSNNCPYKVRRFNWFDPVWDGDAVLMTNPDISLRSKGIMEKCTFCVQRIRSAKDTAKDESRKVRDGEIVPACAQTCPAEAIVFGNMLDANSAVYKLAKSKDSARLLDHLGTEPAVYYLQKEGAGDE